MFVLCSWKIDITALMEFQRYLRLILIVIISCCGLTFGQNSRPNIVIVLADDLVSIFLVHVCTVELQC